MKIAFISFYSGSVNRGSEAFVHELASRISKSHTVHVFQEGKDSTDASYRTLQTPVGVNWKKKDMTGTLWRRFFIDYWSVKIAHHVIKVLPQIWKEKYDIVFPINGGWQPAFLRILTWLYGGKMVVSGQSGIGWDDRNNLWSFPNSFIGLSRKAQAWAKRANPFLKNIMYIPNGADLSKFNPQGEKFKTKLQPPIILCVGAFTKQKRIDLAIKAVSKLSGVSLLVAGDGELKNYLTGLGNRLLGDRFELISVKHEAMPKVYRVADLFTLLPGGSEAFGIVFVEAMATNLPVVTIDDAQRREIVGEAGILVDPDDSEEYHAALKEALGKNWGGIPRKQAEKFDWDNIAKDYEKLFLDLIN